MTLQAWLYDRIESIIQRTRSKLGFRPLLQGELTLGRALLQSSVDEVSDGMPRILKSESTMTGVMKFLIPALDFAISVLSVIAPSTPSQVDDNILAGLKTVRAWLGGGATTTLHQFAAANPTP